MSLNYVIFTDFAYTATMYVNELISIEPLQNLKNVNVFKKQFTVSPSII